MSDPFFAGPEKNIGTTRPTEGGRDDLLKRVARYQRWVLLAILAQVILNILFISGVLGEDIILERLLAGLSLIIAIFSVYSICMLARELFSTAVAVACAVLAIVPLAGLVALLVINQKATKYLQSRGVSVGLLGVNPNSI